MNVLTGHTAARPRHSSFFDDSLRQSVYQSVRPRMTSREIGRALCRLQRRTTQWAAGARAYMPTGTLLC